MPDDLVISQVSQNIKLFEDEGLESLEDYRHQLTLLHKAYAALGDAKNYESCSIKMANAYLACGDPESMQIALFLVASATDPVGGNPNWEKRKKLENSAS